MKKALSLILLCGIATVGYMPNASAADVKAIVTGECVRCHSAGRICRMLGRKDQAAWTQTIQRMVQKGSKLDKAQQDAMAKWLTDLKPGSAPVCK